jgi:hypothetical protein
VTPGADGAPIVPLAPVQKEMSVPASATGIGLTVTTTISVDVHVAEEVVVTV